MKSNSSVSICFDVSNCHAFNCVGSFLKAGFVISDLELDADGNTLFFKLEEVVLGESF